MRGSKNEYVTIDRMDAVCSGFGSIGLYKCYISALLVVDFWVILTLESKGTYSLGITRGNTTPTKKRIAILSHSTGPSRLSLGWTYMVMRGYKSR